MATQLFFRSDAAAPGIHRGTNSTKLDTNASGWTPSYLAASSRGGSVVTETTNTVNGATNGVESVNASGFPSEWYSGVIGANATISGTITVNLWGSESSMSANVAINVIIERIDVTGAVASTIANTARVTELGLTTSAVNNFTVTPTSTNMVKGDRIRVRVYGDDVGTMATGFTWSFYYNGPTAAASGDSYITLTETLTFNNTGPTGTVFYLLDNTVPQVGLGTAGKEMWTSSGAATLTAVTDTATGWTTPFQITDTAGGTAIEWYTRPLTAFTLSGLVEIKIPCFESSAAANCGIRYEVAVCNYDGGGATVWGAQSIVDVATPNGTLGTGTNANGELTTSAVYVRGYFQAPDVSVTNGQRLRLRIYLDDTASLAMVSGNTVTVNYNNVNATDQAFLRITSSVTEFTYKSDPIRARIRRFQHLLAR